MLLFPQFYPTLFCFSCIQSLDFLPNFLIYLLVEFTCYQLVVRIYFYSFYLDCVARFFYQYLLTFLSQNSLVYFFSLDYLTLSLFICMSSYVLLSLVFLPILFFFNLVLQSYFPSSNYFFVLLGCSNLEWLGCWLTFLPYKLDYLNRWCHILEYFLAIYSTFTFLIKLSSSLDSIMTVIL